MTPRLSRLLRWAIAGTVAVALAAVIWIVASIATDRPVAYASMPEQFKYRSIGSEPGASLLRPVGGALPPSWIFRAMPEICRDKLPGGNAALASSSSPDTTCRLASRSGGGSGSTRSA